MDFTPRLENISEDSGCVASMTFECSTSIQHSTSNAQTYVETPTNVSCTSRKRKFLRQNDFAARNLSDFQTSTFESSFTSPALFESGYRSSQNFLSSTLNESLAVSFEKCNLDNYTPNFYIERSSVELELEQYPKKCRMDESFAHKPMTRSAPSTPTKELQQTEPNIVKAQSEILGKLSYKMNSYQTPRLGSPEVMELLYPNIQEVSPAKYRSPQKLLDSLKKLHSPAKKRLFESSNNSKKTYKKVDRDPISVFFVKNNCHEVIFKIFDYLSETDLYNVSLVSTSWKNALFSNKNALLRYSGYVELHKGNKENFVKVLSPFNEPDSPPVSPKRQSFHKCTKLASALLPDQSLQMCPQCNDPAVVQNNIGQCQNLNCQYIYCLRCQSFSITGPENFTDNCQMSKLVLDNKCKSLYRNGLADISNANNDDLPQFFLEDSLNMSPSRYDSSGYLSEADSPIIKTILSSSVGREKNTILKDCNRSYRSTLKRNRRASLVSVVSSSAPKITEIMEPSSPPKVKVVACSQQSKKNLKRLKF